MILFSLQFIVLKLSHSISVVDIYLVKRLHLLDLQSCNKYLFSFQMELLDLRVEPRPPPQNSGVGMGSSVITSVLYMMVCLSAHVMMVISCI